MHKANSIVTGSTRIEPVKPENKVRTVQKLDSGDLFVTLKSGETYTVKKDEEIFQAFVVWTVLADS